jgi:hypothetical protein
MMKNDGVYVPMMPSGSALYTGLVVRHRTTGSVSKDQLISEIYGTSLGRNVKRLLGVFPQKISERMFCGTVSDVEVLLKHTLYGYHSRSLVEDSAKKLVSDLRNGNCVSSRYHIAAAMDSVVHRAPWRQCRAFADEDLKTNGIPCWRVIHQLPFLSHCPVHRRSLISKCSYCSGFFDMGNSFRLPGDPCMHCGTKPSDFVSNNLIPDSFSLLCLETFSFGVSGLHPMEWAYIVQQVLEYAGNAKLLICSLEEKLMRMWRVNSLDEIGLILGISFSRREILEEIFLFSRPFCITQRLVVLDAIFSIFSRADLDCKINDLPFRHGSGNAKSIQKNPDADLAFSDIELLAIGAGLPLGFLKVCKFYKNDWGSDFLKKFLKSLPPCLWHELSRGDYFISIDDNFSNVYIPTFKHIGHKERREFYRQRLLLLMHAEPCTTRTSARRSIPRVINWLMSHDRKWYEATLVNQRKYTSNKERRDFHRQQLLSLIRREPNTTRISAKKSISSSTQWLMKHDRKWFEKTLVDKRRYKNLAERRNFHRQRLLLLMHREPNTTRSSARQLIAASAAWLAEYDEIWHNKKLPRRHFRQNVEPCSGN